MKRKPISILHAAVALVAAGTFCLSANVNAQTNTSTSDNPHLRKKSEPAKTQQAQLSDKDRNFIQTAASGGVAEVVDSKVVEERGESAEAKKVAAHMVADHSRANNELKELAKKKGLDIDLSKGKARTFRKENFDGDYLATMESDHKTDIKAFEAEAKSGDDPEIKAWATKTLPTLKSHLAMVKSALKNKAPKKQE